MVAVVSNQPNPIFRKMRMTSLESIASWIALWSVLQLLLSGQWNVRYNVGKTQGRGARVVPVFVAVASAFGLGVDAAKTSTKKKSGFSKVPYQRKTSKEDSASLMKDLDTFIYDATSYLVRISHTPEQDPTFPGRFTYQTDLRKSLDPALKKNYWNDKSHYQFDYNLLRHNGAIYALSQAYARNREVLKEGHSRIGVGGGSKSTAGTAPLSALQQPTLERLQESIVQTMERAVGYLRDNALLPVPNHQAEWLAAWERTDIDDPHSEPETAKLGGAGLAMIALGRMEVIKPRSVSLEKELRKLGAFVESLQRPEDGGFVSKYEWRDGPNNEWASLYYPGEAALGLMTLAELELEREQAAIQKQKGMITSADLELEHQHYPQHHHQKLGGKNKPVIVHSRRWITIATRALLYLERLRRDQELEDIEPDHWALLATAQLLPLLDRQRKEAPKGRVRKQADLDYWLVYHHGVRVATSMVADHTTKGLEEHQGCFTYDSRTCATATRLEGLLAALTFVQESELFPGGNTEDGDNTNEEGDPTELLRDRIERDVGMGIRFLLQAQQKSNQNKMRGAVPGMYTGKTPVLPHLGKEDSSNSEDEEDEDFQIAEVRVDYVQHSLSAVLAYEAFLKARANEAGARKGFHQAVHETVRKVAAPIIHHVKRRLDMVTRSTTMVNYAVLCSVVAFVAAVVGLAYCPGFCFGRRRRRKRRVERND